MKQIQWYPGHMAKTKRQLKEKMKQIDVVLELVDARVPFSSMNPIIKDIINKTKRVIVMNKADLADQAHIDMWQTYFTSKNIPSISVNAQHQKTISTIYQLLDDVTKDMKAKAHKRGIDEPIIRVMIVGIPNVGKSTFINKLAGKKKLKIGDKPGVTRQTQFITVTKGLEIMDTPGILWPKFDDEKTALKLALIGSIKDSILPIDNVVIYGLNYLITHKLKKLEEHYNITVTDDIVDVLDQIGRSRGCIQRGNEIDYERVYYLFLHDIRHMAFGPICLDEVSEIETV
ncbi:MAG: ribosome biogenesis GTPase YlqF [Candidatus Izimaplasma sp.]|nr:ribosome biogenesis GTPase YlqF [Candidatus Izimaplasma bacterium]